MSTKLKLERVGESKVNKYGEHTEIIKYKNSANVVVRVANEVGYVDIKTRYSSFERGSIPNPLRKTVCEVGYLGVGKYKVRENVKRTNEHCKWHSMMSRCYGKNINKMQSYKDCSVIEEWHNFQNFAKWHEENYYSIDGELMHLDKDILVKNNNVYGSNTCIYVPERINGLFVKQKKLRGDNPIGVHYGKRDKKYGARCRISETNEYKSLGCYRNKIDAFNAYKSFKENLIKEVAERYKNKIPKILYDALYSYEVSIND